MHFTNINVTMNMTFAPTWSPHPPTYRKNTAENLNSVKSYHGSTHAAVAGVRGL